MTKRAKKGAAQFLLLTFIIIGVAGLLAYLVAQGGTAFASVPANGTGAAYVGSLDAAGPALAATTAGGPSHKRGMLPLPVPTLPVTITAVLPTPRPGTPRPTSSVQATVPHPVPSAPATITVCTVQFTDVPVGATFYPYVHCLACRGVATGYTCGGVNPLTGEAEPCDAANNPYFRYNNRITRGQISKLVSNAAGLVDDPGGQIFEDTAPGSPFYIYVNRLQQRGVMSGYPCGLLPSEPCVSPGDRPYFRPLGNASRGQLSKITANSAGFVEMHSGQTFEDVTAATPFYTYIERLASRNAMGGYPCGSANPESGDPEPCGAQNLAYFRTGNSITRGQAVKIAAISFFPACGSAAKK
ncbi:MAG: S-layer homology domain-containing protein [Chloroflexota bacterium]|nr:S-layer homology domain-containing protein [Chloroflexota bacterium]